jgi:hypothetical protein
VRARWPVAMMALLLLSPACPSGDDGFGGDAGDDDDSTDGPPDGPMISTWPDAIEFGTVALGTDAVSTFTIENVGDESLLVGSVSMLDGYELFDVEAFDGQRLEPGEYVDLLAMFHATVEGDASNMIRISSNDPEKEVIDIPVSASAAEPT